MLKHFTLFFTALLWVTQTMDGQARPKRINQIPNGLVNQCANCHVNPAGGGPRNAFGQTVEANFLDGNGDVIWGYALAMLDSDGDGLPNGVELGDPNALWMQGNQAPGLLDRVRLPGNPQSKLGDVLTVQFSNMTPHIGQKFEIRVIDRGSRTELVRNQLAAINSAEFQMTFSGMESGHSYRIDFYADLNQNGLYDKPGSDHAWRLDLNNFSSDTTLTFVHNTTFTDIEWPYQATIEFAGMAPHVGQKLELRMINRKTRKEVSRKTIETIESAGFSVNLPGTETNGDYWIDFYADLNKNGHYDKPPADHAWRIELEDVEGDAILNFTHNTDFTDINWKYQMTLQLAKMTPHLNELFEMRVIDLLTQQEIGRQKVPVIDVPDFEVTVPNIDIDGYYQIDFYADHNNNELYDPPPTDHAWRLTSGLTQGNTVVPFTHNTNFTSIDWTYLFTLEVSSLDPHLNQLFEIRLTDQSNGMEVGRSRLDSVYINEFTLETPGLRPNRTYNVDFYADHNKNGIYDAPPADHAWRLILNSGDDGDNEMSFTHNTSFTDINWAYLFTLDLNGMTPHLGQYFKLVLIDQQTMSEVGQVAVENIPAADFSVSVGGIRSGAYQADFFADHNGNGSYDAPPADHAWRQEFTESTADYILSFTHNTNFTDIGLPTAIEYLTADGLPETYHLAQNFPNPFNPSTTIRFDLPAAGTVRLDIFNNLGQRVRTLVESRLPAGRHQILWDGKNESGIQMGSGLYFYQLHSGTFREIKKMMLIK